MYGRSANAQSSREADEQISHSYSKDSAIDSDFQEWETELINLDIVRLVLGKKLKYWAVNWMN